MSMIRSIGSALVGRTALVSNHKIRPASLTLCFELVEFDCDRSSALPQRHLTRLAHSPVKRTQARPLRRGVDGQRDCRDEVGAASDRQPVNLKASAYLTFVIALGRVRPTSLAWDLPSFPDLASQMFPLIQSSSALHAPADIRFVSPSPATYGLKSLARTIDLARRINMP